MTRLKLPSVSRPFVLVIFGVLAFYLALAVAQARSAPLVANHPPRLTKSSPLIRYYQAGSAYDDYFLVHDSDLVSSRGDSISVQMNAPSGFSIELSRVTDALYLAHIHAAKLPDHHARLKVTLLARDAAGEQDIYTYQIGVSEPALFSMELTISNTEDLSPMLFHRQYLTFGIGTEGLASTGSEKGNIGALDTLYCEYELPPAAPIQQFDARWEIPLTAGTLWNLYPESHPELRPLPPWYFTVNPGGSDVSEYLPITISWSAADAARSPRPLHLLDRSGMMIDVDMRDGSATTLVGGSVRRSGDTITLSISLGGIDRFMIRQEGMSGVEDRRAIDHQPTTIDLQ